MRIVFVIPYFHPALQYGGQPRSAFELARGLLRRGHTVRVLTTDSGGDARLPDSVVGNGEKRTIDGIDVTYYRNISNFLAFRHRVFWPPVFFRELDKQLAGSDVVHIHELRSFTSVAASACAERQRVPFVLSPHGGLRHLGKRRTKALFDRIWGRSILDSAAALIAVSPAEEADARNLDVPRARIWRIPNAVCLSDFENLPHKGVFRARYGIGDRKLVLFFGRLHWIKGADLLVQAFAALCEGASTNAHLVLAGPDDGQELELRRMVSQKKLNDRVTFTGFLNDEKRNEALVDCDLLVVPSRSEVFAIAAVEALTCAKPVLLSSACSLYPAPAQDQGVRSFDSFDPDALRLALDEALNDPALSVAALRGRGFVERNFSISAVAEKAECVYEEVIKRVTRRNELK